MPVILIRHPDGRLQEVDVQKIAAVGRLENNDIVLVGSSVSRRHARLLPQFRELLIEDCGSINGTFIDGERINGRVQLGPEMEAQIGDYTITLRGSKIKAALRSMRQRLQPAKQPEPIDDLPQTSILHNVKLPPPKPEAKRIPSPFLSSAPILRGVSGGFENLVFAVNGSITIGRGSDVDLNLEDNSVSRLHARIEKTIAGYIIVDLNSTNGTYLNNEWIGREYLEVHDRLKIGTVELEFEASEKDTLEAVTAVRPIPKIPKPPLRRRIAQWLRSSPK